jgi:adenine phosphoribosyltransferase
LRLERNNGEAKFPGRSDRGEINLDLYLAVKQKERRMEGRLTHLKSLIKSHPDFPKPGILFRDMFPLLRDPKAFKELKSVMVDYTKENIPKIDVVVGLESRGFIFGSVLAAELELPFVPIRKPGKLPGELSKVEYLLEYGSDSFEIQKEGLEKGQNVLLVDDLLATGGSLSASCQLIEIVGAKVAGCFVIMELDDLQGRSKLKYPVHSLFHF